jgi:hypothetical protein
MSKERDIIHLYGLIPTNGELHHIAVFPTKRIHRAYELMRLMQNMCFSIIYNQYTQQYESCVSYVSAIKSIVKNRKFDQNECVYVLHNHMVLFISDSFITHRHTMIMPNGNLLPIKTQYNARTETVLDDCTIKDHVKMGKAQTTFWPGDELIVFPREVTKSGSKLFISPMCDSAEFWVPKSTAGV